MYCAILAVCVRGTEGVQHKVCTCAAEQYWVYNGTDKKRIAHLSVQFKLAVVWGQISSRNAHSTPSKGRLQAAIDPATRVHHQRPCTVIIVAFWCIADHQHKSSSFFEWPVEASTGKKSHFFIDPISATSLFCLCLHLVFSSSSSSTSKGALRRPCPASSHPSPHTCPSRSMSADGLGSPGSAAGGAGPLQVLLNVYDVAQQGDSKGTVVRLNNLVGPKGLGLGGEQLLQGAAGRCSTAQLTAAKSGLPWTRRPLRVDACVCLAARPCDMIQVSSMVQSCWAAWSSPLASVSRVLACTPSRCVWVCAGGSHMARAAVLHQHRCTSHAPALSSD